MNDENLTARGRGRPLGAKSKVSKAAKEVIAQAAEAMGGADRLLAWTKEAPENEKAFWTTIYPKLVSLTVSGPGEEGEHVMVLKWRE